MANEKRGPRIVYLVTEDWYFWTHRLRLALVMQNLGFEVYVMTKSGEYVKRMQELGLRVIPWKVSRAHRNPLRDLFALFQVARVYWRLRPAIVHHIALKPIVLGGIVASLLDIPSVSAINGLGHAFCTDSTAIRAVRTAILWLCRYVFQRNRSLAIFQNATDRDLFVERGIIRADRAVMIPGGAGVDVNVFRPAPGTLRKPIVLLAARMLWEKGVGEFVQAAQNLKSRGKDARFLLAGRVDREAAAPISERQLRQWEETGAVEWLGHREDILPLLREATVVVLPSYREGMPKILLEAAACGCPIITTDSPGCREVVEHGVNGLLVPPRDGQALADAIAILLDSPELCAEMGQASRKKAEREFSIDKVIERTIQMYARLMGREFASHEVCAETQSVAPA